MNLVRDEWMDRQINKAEKIFNRLTKKTNVYESVVLIENVAGDFSHHFDYGGKHIDSPILIASITKLFTTACIFILQEKGKLSLNDKLAKFIDEKYWRHLHVYKGHDYSNELTIAHLLCQTSGLRDVIDEGSQEAKKRVIYTDTCTSFSKIIEQTKKTTPHFAPGSSNRAHYTNVNFDILGKVIERVTELPLVDVYSQFIFKRLNLENTYLPKGIDDFVPNIYYKNRSLHRPKAVQSSGASGGCVSTARELMIFLKAFYTGGIFRNRLRNELTDSKKLQLVMYPIQYSVGFMKIPMNGLTTMFMGKGELIGHSGSTGSFAFYYPEKEMFFVGDVNQMATPALPVRTAIQLAMSVS